MMRPWVWRIVWQIGWMVTRWVLRSRRKGGILQRAKVWDQAISRRIAQSALPFPHWVIQLGAHLGDLWLWTLIAAVFSWFGRGRRWWRWGMSIVNSAVVTLALKRLFRRKRPTALRRLYSRWGDQYSFPSGHAARWGTILVWAWQKPIFMVPALAGTVWTGWSRVRLGIHSVGDIVAGFSIGLLLTALWRRLT